MKSRLILIPTPIEESLPIEPIAKELLAEQCLNSDFLILVEEHKVARQRWLKWGLPREAIDRFILFNEHTQAELKDRMVSELKAGKTIALMSDGGLPAFCDPGQKLVRNCHESGIPVTSTPFPNSIALAVAMSGMDHSRFLFAGFLPVDPTERKKELDQLSVRQETLILMDTPYRLSALVSDLGTSRLKGRKFFLAANLNSASESSFYGDYQGLQRFADTLHKPEFVLVVSGV